MNPDLPFPARYFPIRGSKYDVAPAFRPLGASFGNGDADAHVFQFDTDFPDFRRNKLACRTERAEKYVCADAFDTPVASAVARFIVQRLASEHPAFFTWTQESGGALVLDCRLTSERLIFDEQMRLVRSALPYTDVWDALCCQVPEDLAVVRRTPERGDWLAALHVCAPSHWSPGEKIGKSFTHTHDPVPGFEKNHAAAHSLVDIMVRCGPFVRFTWGIEFDDRLNHHPEPPPGISAAAWNPPRRLDSSAAVPFVFRVERQVLWPLPEVDAGLFTIRVYRYEGREICANETQRRSLADALRSMSLESRVYKGLTGDGMEEVLALLDSPPSYHLTPTPLPQG